MKATRILTLALATSLMGTVGCAQNVPNVPAAQTPEIPQVQAVANGDVAPDQLLVDNFQTMVNGKAMTMEEIRKQLPARISAADAAKMLVKLDMDKVAKDGDYDTQQWRGRFGGRGFIGRGFHGGLGFRSRFLGFGRGLGFGGLGFFPYSSYYFPYYYNAGYYYPYSYNFANTLCSPYLYGYGGSYFPYTYGCGLGGLGYGGYGGYGLGYGGFGGYGGCW